MCFSVLFFRGAGANPCRLRSATIMPEICRRLVSRASSNRVASSDRARTSGRMRSANSARTRASRRSVLASWPVARATLRTCRGLATTTGIPGAARALMTGTSKSPVASRTAMPHVRPWRSSSSAWIPCIIIADGPGITIGADRYVE